ncbi:uncharacterized protein LOC111498720 isoform X2 [Cucurbita maxima]|uniref:Uncharacterized protein LOC111498720 isoform X2 n=1 Tax=Cucurbita maxima TaxID=3661 RepID=A0A6J1L3A4_CUCMA|nr:uncharacterized protein LOC111498720 isoform X2 [Cucurbita maxima]
MVPSKIREDILIGFYIRKETWESSKPKRQRSDRIGGRLDQIGPRIIELSSTPRWKGIPLCSCLFRASSSSMEFPPERYRRNVGISRFNFSGKIFAASWLNRQEIFEMPQGKISKLQPRSNFCRNYSTEACNLRCFQIEIQRFSLYISSSTI